MLYSYHTITNNTKTNIIRLIGIRRKLSNNKLWMLSNDCSRQTYDYLKETSYSKSWTFHNILKQKANIYFNLVGNEE